jgi:hypothetical protein
VPHRVLKKKPAHGDEGFLGLDAISGGWAKLSRPAPRMRQLLPNEIGGQNRNSSLDPGPKTGRQHLFAYKRGYCEARLA